MTSKATASATSEAIAKEGVEIKGKDVIVLNSPEVLLSPDTPLDTEAQDIAGAINELKALFEETEEGSDGNLRVISDNNSNTLIIRIEKNEDEETIVTDNNYSYVKAAFSEEIKTAKTAKTKGYDGSETTVTTTNTKIFSRSIITNLYDSSGIEILHAECDEKGNISGYFDSDGNEIKVG